MCKSTLFSVLPTAVQPPTGFHGLKTKRRDIVSKVWGLPSTIETTPDNISEDKTSLINISSVTSPDMGPALNNKDSPVLMFIKVPLEDRNKYEKLNSNDITSDDSDSEFFRLDTTTCGKRATFKQIVTNNIPEKIQAVYHKVDKTQIKVPIVKKLRQVKSSVVNKEQKSEVKKISSKNKTQKIYAEKKVKENSDDDSIGSASDLRANDDILEEEYESGMERNATIKRANHNKDDAISESIQTCGSSAYHAECESVTTHEDDVSRIMTRKVRMKRRDRMNDSTNTITNLDQISPTSADLLHQYGDKPLLLDDELDYESSETTDNKCKSGDEDEDVDDGLDVFAMAPFKMPISVPKKNRPKYKPTDIPIPEDSNLLNFCDTPSKSSLLVTSTPKKTNQNVVIAYLPESDKQEPFDPPQPKLRHEQCFAIPTQPLAPAKPSQNVAQSKSDYGIVTVVNTSAIKMSPKLVKSDEVIIAPVTVNVSKTDKDLFGLEPFPTFVNKIETNDSNFTIISIENNNNQVKSDIINHPSNSNSLITVNQSIVIDKHLCDAHQTSKNYINFSQIGPYSDDKILPIADNEFVSFVDDEEKIVEQDDDDNKDLNKKTEEVKKTKMKKEKIKYFIKEKSKNKDSESSSSSVMVLPTKLSHKVKVNVSYKKVQSIKSKKVEDPSALKVKGQLGFNNMSFEDFPSDQEVDEPFQPVNSANIRTAPFEVFRNEKMLMEAEKKFGSLKRRSNPFS